MKYTAADVREKRISFKGLTQEQFLTLQAHFHKLYPEDGYMNYEWGDVDKYHRFYADTDNPGHICYGTSVSYLGLGSRVNSTLEITFEEFDFQLATNNLLEEIDTMFKPLFDKYAPPKSILIEAEELINGERAKDYGKVRDNFNNIAIGWNVIIDGKPVTARKVGLMMTWLKICRDVQNPKQDNLVDGAGYFGCIDKMSREQ